MKIQAGKAYRDEWGKVRHVMGLAGRPSYKDQPIYWTLEGDHYTEDGRLMWGSEPRDTENPRTQ